MFCSSSSAAILPKLLTFIMAVEKTDKFRFVETCRYLARPNTLDTAQWGPRKAVLWPCEERRSNEAGKKPPAGRTRPRAQCSGSRSEAKKRPDRRMGNRSRLPIALRAFQSCIVLIKKMQTCNRCAATGLRVFTNYPSRFTTAQRIKSTVKD